MYGDAVVQREVANHCALEPADREGRRVTIGTGLDRAYFARAIGEQALEALSVR